MALACAFSVLIYVSYLLGERYHNKPFQTIVAHSHASIDRIAFPVVIICNKNRLNWSRLPEIKQRYNITADKEKLFEQILTAYDGLSFQQFNVFDSLRGEDLESMNVYNFTEIASEMAWRCSEILADCVWQSQSRDCCKLFRPRRLPLGLCLAFNELEQRKGVSTGLNTGLMLRLLLREEDHAPGNLFPKGFLVGILMGYSN